MTQTTDSKAAEKFELEIPVETKGLGFGKNTCRLGFSVDRDNMNINNADIAFSNSRHDVVLILEGGEGKQIEGQTHIESMKDDEFAGSCDIKGFNTSPGSFSAGLTFNINNIDVEKITHFKYKTATLKIARTGTAIEAKEDHDDEGDEASDGPLLDQADEATDGDWQLKSLDGIIPDAVVKAAKSLGITTIGSWRSTKQDSRGGEFKKSLEHAGAPSIDIDTAIKNVEFHAETYAEGILQ